MIKEIYRTVPPGMGYCRTDTLQWVSCKESATPILVQRHVSVHANTAEIWVIIPTRYDTHDMEIRP